MGKESMCIMEVWERLQEELAPLRVQQTPRLHQNAALVYLEKGDECASVDMHKLAKKIVEICFMPVPPSEILAGETYHVTDQLTYMAETVDEAVAVALDMLKPLDPMFM